MKVISIGEEHYPSALRHIYNPPPKLYYLGEGIERLNHFPLIAIVGSRNADHTGVTIAKQLANELADYGGTIVSGLALGIDAAAHAGALLSEGNLPTVAVLGNGLPALFPKSNESLGQAILKRGGIILSHFEPGTPPMPHNFLDRNRIISGLSQGVVLVQAGDRSGALNTARHALEQGREVLAVPGAPGDPRFAGTNKLIQDGAALVTSAEEIVQALPHCKLVRKSSATPSSNDAKYDETEMRILTYIREQVKVHVDELKRSFPKEEIEEILLTLELSSTLQRLPGNFIAAKKR